MTERRRSALHPRRTALHPVAYAELDRAFRDLIMQTSGNRIARAAVRARESQDVNTVRYTGEPTKELCWASNRGSMSGRGSWAQPIGITASTEGAPRGNRTPNPLSDLVVVDKRWRRLSLLVRKGINDDQF
jgi:hypothetical protein